MKLFTSIDQSFSQIALSDAVGVIAFSDNGVVYVNKYTGADVETLFQFPASPSALALSPNYEYCAYTVADQTFVRELTTNTETVHACKGQIRVNDNGDLLATDPIYFNGPLEVTLHGNLYCTFTDNGYVFASEREIYDGDSTAIMNETIVGLWQKFFVTASGRFFNFSGINIQDTGMEVSHIFDYGNFAGLHVGDSLYVTDGYQFPEKVQTVPLNAPEKISSYALPASVNNFGAGAYRIMGKGVGAPTRISPDVYLHARQTDTLELYVGSKNINSQKFYSAAELDGIVGQFAFDRSDKNEITGQAVELIGNTRIVDGVLRKANGHDSRFNLGVYDFTNTDFTVEFSTCIYAIDPTQTYCMLLGQSVDVGGGYANNSWDVTIFLSNGNLRLLANIYNGTTRSEMVSPQVIEFGKTYHVVFEKVGAVANFYLDSVLIGSLPWASMRIPEDKRLCSWYKNAANTRSFGAFDVSNIRVAKKRLYPTTVSRPRVLPLLPSFEYSTTDYDSFKAFKSIYVVGAENTTQHSISFEQYFDSIKIVSDASLPGLAENPELLKGIVFSTNSYGPPVDDLYTVRQFRFENNSIVDEVTEAEMTLFGAATVSDGMLLVSSANVANYAEFNHVAFDGNEDFYIRVTFSSNVPASNWVNQPILGQWATNAGISSWLVTHFGPGNSNTTRRNKITFIFKDAESVVHLISSAQEVSYSELHTVEVVRKAGTITVYVDGVAGESVFAPLGNPVYNYPKNWVFRFASTNTTEQGGGRRDDIQIIKGAFDFTPGIKPALPKYVRPVYSEEDASAIVLQMGFRRGSGMCEKYDTPVTLNGTAAIGRNARLTQTNVTTSWMQIAVPYFGAGDFTIECVVNITSSSTGGIQLLGQFHATSITNVNNKWLLLYNTGNQRLTFLMCRSGTAGDYVTTGGITPVTLNTDTHIVVERIGTTVTIFQNGIVSGQSEAFDMPMHTETTNFVKTQDQINWRAGAFSMWNIRIADKALYNGTIEQLPAFPALPYYVPSVATGIVVQYRFKEDSLLDEKGTGVVTLAGGASVSAGYIDTGVSGHATFPTPYFGAADFTIDVKFTLIQLRTSSVWNVVLAQYAENIEATQSSWALSYNSSTKILHFLASPSLVQPAIGTTGLPVPELVLGREYHIVVERVGSRLTMYIDGKLYVTSNYATALKQTDIPVSTNSIQGGVDEGGIRRLRDIRIASRALYRGSINNNFKSFQPL